MVKFAHLGDCHLGSWKQPELQELNFQAFQYAIDKCIELKVEFILIAGDLFDSAYPPVEILKRAFGQFRRIKEAGIACYMIAGSHDYSVSGKTFLDVLEHAGFCKMCKFDEQELEDKRKTINLHAIKHENFEIYGYPGKKSGLEVNDLKNIILPDSNKFRILMLHTSVTEAVGSLPIESISLAELPKAEYYALAHLHIDFMKRINNDIPAGYSGPIFPNSFQELEDLGNGSFYVIDVEGFTEATKYEIKLKQVQSFKINITNALTATPQIIGEFCKHDLKNKIVLLRLEGEIEQGTNADIDYQKIKEYLEEKQVYSFLKNTNKLQAKEDSIHSDIKIDSTEMDKIEEELVKNYEKENPDKFNKFIVPLIHALNLEKQEDEKAAIYEARLLEGINKILDLEMR